MPHCRAASGSQCSRRCSPPRASAIAIIARFGRNAAPGNLPLAADPKLAWARVHLAERPIEVNAAERNELLRIPGVGPKGANAILAARRQHRLSDWRDLQQLGIVAARAVPFVLLNGRRPPQQLPLF